MHHSLFIPLIPFFNDQNREFIHSLSILTYPPVNSMFMLFTQCNLLGNLRMLILCHRCCKHVSPFVICLFILLTMFCIFVKQRLKNVMQLINQSFSWYFLPTVFYFFKFFSVLPKILSEHQYQIQILSYCLKLKLQLFYFLAQQLEKVLIFIFGLFCLLIFKPQTSEYIDQEQQVRNECTAVFPFSPG